MRYVFLVALSLPLLLAASSPCSASEGRDNLGTCTHPETIEEEEDETSVLQTRLSAPMRQHSGIFSRRGNQYPTKDINGKPCDNCDNPHPGRGYDGKAVRSSELPADVDLTSLHRAGDYVILDDCGRVPKNNTVALSDYIFNTSTPERNAYPGFTNAWCEFNAQVSSANTFANRDPLFQGKAGDVPRGYAYDFWYCKYNGLLGKKYRQAVASGYEATQVAARNLCSEREAQFGVGFIENITFDAFNEVYNAGKNRGPNWDTQIPTQAEAEWLGAWLCAMGGSNGLKGGQSDGPLGDIGYCVYSYGDLGGGKFCMYEQCEGWNPMHGMPVADLATRAKQPSWASR